MQIVQRFVLARLRNRRFFSNSTLRSANGRRSQCQDHAQDRQQPARVVGDDRASSAQAIAGRALLLCRVEAGSRRPRLPHRDRRPLLLGAVAAHPRGGRARITTSTVEIFPRGVRVASHAFSAVRNRHTTIAEHMPSAHRRYAEWTPARLMREAEKIGSARLALSDAIMHAKPHPERGFPLLPRHPAALQRIWSRPARSRLSARQRHHPGSRRSRSRSSRFEGVGSLWRFAKYARDNRHLMMTARNDAPKLQPKNTSSAASATSAAALCSPEQRRATGAARLGLPR